MTGEGGAPSHPGEHDALLRGALRARGVELLSGEKHRDRWLRGLLQGPGFRGVSGEGAESSGGRVARAVDVGAGILLELPRLEADGWRGWSDPRLTRIWQVLRGAELPPEPPRGGLVECWRDLRAAVPFVLEKPLPGEAPRSIDSFFEEVEEYLRKLGAAVDVVTRRVGPGGGEQGGEHPLPRELLGDRLLAEVERHATRTRRHLLPLARESYWSAFPAQRIATTLQQARGEDGRLGEGRVLRVRAKHRYHLAAWALRQAELSRLEVGLFLCHVDPSGLQTAVGPVGETAWRERLEAEVDNSLTYWTTGAGQRGAGPSAQIGHVEFEMRDFLKPVGFPGGQAPP